MKKYFYLLWLLMASFALDAFSQSMIISGGNDHGIALCSKGQVFAWGYNNGNRLCLAPPNDGLEIASSPCLVNTGNLTFSMLSAGSGGHNVALSCYNVVYCWGGNSQMECGRPASKYITGGEPVPVYKGETPGYTLDGKPGGDYLGNVKYISATSAASMAILDDGTGRAVIWGGNVKGAQIGGGVLNTPTYEPVFIRDANGDPIENVIHITGGDNNIMLIVGDSPDAKVGTVYSVGNWNGRGGDGGAESFVAAPVEIGDGTGAKSSGKYLTNVRTSGLSDSGGMVVDGTTGYVYAWGNAGWWGCGGLRNAYNSNMLYAEKVVSGQYKDISEDEYLTDVLQVVGGNGSAAVVTKEGYVLYWGDNAAAKGQRSGGVIPNSAYATLDGTADKLGPVFATYCKGEKGASEVIVDDAVAIARGDLYGFMVNSSGEFYSWGSTARPGNDSPADVGTLGIGKESHISTCFTKIEISCQPQDLCPEAFMVGPLYKCPGEIDSLYCGFTPFKGSVDNYYFLWSLDGVVLNTSKSTSPVSDRRSDIYNKPTIPVSVGGKYEVEILYIGMNVPCDNCPEAKASIEVIEMDMPIDTFITEMNCVAEPLVPAAGDAVCFEAVVNSKFYKASDKTSFAVFSTESSADTLEVINTTGAGGEIKFCVKGSDIDKMYVNDNRSLPSNDTTYNIWVEDITSFETMLYEGNAPAKTGSFQSYGLLLDVYSTSNLKSFDVYAKSYSGNENVVITPVIYSVDKNNNGNYVPGKVFWTGEEQTFTIDASGPNKMTVKCNLNLPGNKMRGVRYIIGMEFAGNCNLYIFDADARKQNSPEYVSPVLDSNGFGIYAMGATANNYTNMANGGDALPYVNVLFGKLTDYDCGRIMLTARYGCPPCDRPDAKPSNKYVEIESDVAKAADDMVHLCRGDQVTLSVTDVKKTGAEFDILWFENENDMLDDTKAIESDVTGKSSSSSFSVLWDDLTPGVEKTYYVKVRDHNKPDAAACFVFDSIKVMPDTVPVVPEITLNPFCEGKLSLLDLAGYAASFDFSLLNYSVAVTDAAGTPVNLAMFAAGLNKMPAGVYEYDVVVTDDATSCVSDPAKTSLEIYEVPEKPVVKEVSLLKTPNGVETIASGATPLPGNKLIWYSKTDLSDGQDDAFLHKLDVAGEFYYYVSQVSAEGCESDTATVVVVVNDAPKPVVRDTMVCAGETVNLADQATALDANHVLYWYDKKDAVKGSGDLTSPVHTETTPGEYKYYVSQMNTVTNAESEKSEVVVTVYDVMTPVTVTDLNYCIKETALPLDATMAEDAATFFGATGVEWYDGVVDPANLVKTITPNTLVAGVYKYNVRQFYTLPIKGGATCYGLPVEVTVTVNQTAVPTSSSSFTFNYLKAEGAATLSYVDLLTKDPAGAVAEADCELVWYDKGGNELPGVPSPDYVAGGAGVDRTETYYVAQKNKLTGCTSEKVEVIVNISDSPMPIVSPVSYCEDAPAVPLVATINATIGNYAESDYELIWYDGNPDNGGTVLPSAPTPSVKISDPALKEETTVYYVTQKNLQTGSESKASEIKVTVYARPILKTLKPDAVCFPDVVELTNYYDVSSAVPANEILVKFYYSDGNVMQNKRADVSGTYLVTGEFIVPGTTNMVCISDKENIDVTVDKLSNLEITGSATTCPNTPVSLTAASDYNTATVEYDWSGSNGDSYVGSPFQSSDLAGVAGDQHEFTVVAKAGACSLSASHTVTIGDGPIVGDITISEEDNADWSGQSMKASSVSSITLYSCGKGIELSPSMTKTAGDYVWTKDGVAVGTNDVKLTEGGTYRVSYINECPTFVDIKVASVPLLVTPSNTSLLICEGESFSAVLDINCPEKEKVKIEWFKDGTKIANTSDAVSYPSAEPDNSGVYSYRATNRGCVSEGAVADGNKLLVRPYIKASIEKDHYVARRDSVLDLKIDFTEPANGVLSKISWEEYGSLKNSTADYSLTVDKDYDFDISLSDPNYCDAKLKVSVDMDARLQLTTDLVAKMCYGETKILTIDTTGTGKFIYRDRMSLTVTETLVDNGAVRELNNWVLANGKLVMQVSPLSTALYTVTFSYREGDAGTDPQLIVHELPITVIEPINITVPQGLAVCGNGDDEIEVALQVTPKGTVVSWDNPSGYIKGNTINTTVVSFSPEFTGNPEVHKQKHTLVAKASYDICDVKTAYVDVMVDEPIAGAVKGDSIICEGFSSVLDASAYDAETYTWTSQNDFEGSMDGVTITVNPTQPFTYYEVDMTRGTCTAKGEYVLMVSSNPQIASVDSITFKDVEIMVDPAYGKAPFVFWVDKEDSLSVEPVITNLSYGEHTAFVRDDIGCMGSYKFVINAPSLKFPVIISPNGDGYNDVFTVPSLAEAYPNANVSIYDRFGKLLVSYKGADEGWDGTYNGVAMPTTDYWYEIEIKEIGKTYIGHFTLLRQ